MSSLSAPWRPSSHWPFRAARAPFFYGWVVLAVSTLGILVSIPGQTMGMAVFTEPLMAALGLTRTQLSLAYLLGTVTSATLLTHAGRLYDRHGGRVLVVGSSLGLAATLIAIAALPALLALLEGRTRTVVAFAAIFLGYLGVRFSGQGVLTSASRNVLMAWFERRRGTVSGVSGVFVSLGFSLAPPVLAALIALFGWQGALVALAIVCGPAFALLALVFLRDDPESCGLRADGAAPEPDAPAVAVEGDRLEVVRRSPVFWIYSGALAMHALFGTAIVFHVVSIFAEAGRSEEAAFGFFLPLSVVSISANLVASWASDRTALRPWLLIMLCGFLVACFGMTRLDTPLGLLLLLLGNGIGGGVWGMISNITFVRLFGRAHLGAVSGLNASLTVGGSALGPALFAVGLDASGSFTVPVAICAAGFVILLGAALVVRRLPAEGRP